MSCLELLLNLTSSFSEELGIDIGVEGKFHETNVLDLNKNLERLHSVVIRMRRGGGCISTEPTE